MKQFINILFLGLTILFSFGFSSFQSVCDEKIEVIETNHSCCKDESVKKEISQNKHQDGCCGTDSCQGSCCIESVDFLILTDFVFQTESFDINKLEIKLIPSLHTFLHKLEGETDKVFEQTLRIPPDLFVYSSNASQIILEKQAWLI